MRLFFATVFLSVSATVSSCATTPTAGEPPIAVCGTRSPEGCAPLRNTPRYESVSIVEAPQEVPGSEDVRSSILPRFGLMTLGGLPADGPFCTTSGSPFTIDDLDSLPAMNFTLQQDEGFEGSVSLSAVLSQLGRLLGLNSDAVAELTAGLSASDRVVVEYTGSLQAWQIDPALFSEMYRPDAPALLRDCMEGLRRQPDSGIVAALSVATISSYSLTSTGRDTVTARFNAQLDRDDEADAQILANLRNNLASGVNLERQDFHLIVGYSIWTPDHEELPINASNQTMRPPSTYYVAYRVIDGEPPQERCVCNRTPRLGNNNSSHDVRIIVDGSQRIHLNGYRPAGEGQSQQCALVEIADELVVSRYERDTEIWLPLTVVVEAPFRCDESDWPYNLQ